VRDPAFFEKSLNPQGFFTRFGAQAVINRQRQHRRIRGRQQDQRHAVHPTGDGNGERPFRRRQPKRLHGRCESSLVEGRGGEITVV